MSKIFKIIGKKKVADEKRVIGAYVSILLLEYINLFGMVHSQSLADIVTELLKKWKDEQERRGHFLDALICQVSEMAHKQWLDGINEKDTHSTDFFKFVRSVENELNKKAISQYTISQIIENLKTLNNAKK